MLPCWADCIAFTGQLTALNLKLCRGLCIWAYPPTSPLVEGASEHTAAQSFVCRYLRGGFQQHITAPDGISHAASYCGLV